jgi:ABC-2 type transport system ATP-binding protein
VQDIGLRRPTLDDVFLSLTGHGAEDAQEEAARKARKAGRKKPPEPRPDPDASLDPVAGREDDDEKEVAAR